MDVEAVSEHERLAFGHVRGDFVLVGIALDVVGDEDHDGVGDLGGVGDAENFETGGFGFRDAFAGGGEADHNVQAGIAQVERVRVALATVTDDGDGLFLERREAAVFFIESTWHSVL